jgi:hypothetical protein
MEKFWRFAPWISRISLVLPIALFAFIGSKYLTDPVLTAAMDNITLGSPAAVTDMRVVGSLFLACGLITAFFLLSTQRLLAGLYFVLTIVVTLTLVRLSGYFVDGAVPTTAAKLKVELALLIIFTCGILFERARLRRP